MEKRKTISSLTNIKSAVVVHPRTAAQESQEHLDVMNRMVNDTDEHLRQALEHTAVRHEQLDELHHRSEEMLQKNENLVFGNCFFFIFISCLVDILFTSMEISFQTIIAIVFHLKISKKIVSVVMLLGITNYRKNQERDLFWRRFQYTAFGVITIGVIILLIILSMTSKRSTTSSQILDVRYSNADLRSQTENEKKSNLTMTVSRRRRRRRRRREVLI